LGKGFATEAAFASVRYGFEKLNFQCIAGRTEPENIGSWRVLEKIGMDWIGQDELDGYLVRLYEIQNTVIR